MTTSIVIETHHLAALRAHLLQDQEYEHAAFLLGGFARWEGGSKFLVREAVPVPPEGFLEQDEGRLVIAPAFFNSVMKRAGAEGRSVIVTHSHPGAAGPVDFSWVDDAGERAMFTNLYRRVPDQPHASMVFGPEAVAARSWAPDGTCQTIDQLVIVGSRLEVVPLKTGHAQTDDLHDRQVRAFGSAGQERLTSVVCAVVGVGGTGPALRNNSSGWGSGVSY